MLFGIAGSVGSVASAQSFDDLAFRSIGPAVMGGRIGALAVVEQDPATFYVGTASGGLWKTVNNGTTWTPVFDDQGTSSIGDVAVSSSDPEIVWVGTGEANNRQSSSAGDGVYRSLDGGKSWSHRGLGDSGHIGKVVIDPSNPDRVFVAAGGNLWRAGGERGVYRTLDAGLTWKRVLEIDEDTGVTTLELDPVNPDVLYAAAYQRRRTPWGFDGGGPGSGLYKTMDGGESWSPLSRGLPEGALGRIGIAVFRGDARIVYALVEHESEGGVYRSNDRGESWERVNELNPRPMYYSKIFVDPTDSRRVYVLGAPFYVSDDGGRTFVTNRSMTPRYDVGVHGDHHALWIDPRDPEHLILGGDGGLYFSWDRSQSFVKVNNLPIAQFYAIAVDLDEPYHVYGGAQDTHSWMGPSATRHHIGILNSDWVQTNFGDGMYQQVDPTDSSIVYTESQGGNLVRLDRRTGNRTAIKPYPESGDARYRFHWTSPLRISRHDAATLYFGGNRLFISRDRGDSWSASPDLTRQEDRDELPIMGSIPGDHTLSRHDGVAEWGTITTISESPLDEGTLYVGTDDGRVQLTRDGGERWESLEAAIPGMDPRWSKVSRIVASAAKAGRAYVSFDRHALGDMSPYLFVTEDFGKEWTRLTLPDGIGWVNVVVEHPDNGSLLFVGTETGLFVSFDRGRSWLRMTGALPTVPVDDLVIHPREGDLVVGTHGRSIYILDDASPLARHRPGDAAARIFEPRTATIFLPWKHESYGAQRQFVGENPPFGAIVTYHLPRSVDGGVTLSVHDTDGNFVSAVDGVADEGFNRIVWDLRTEPPDAIVDGRGPLVPPGRYRLTLEVGGEVLDTTVNVVLDGRTDVTPAEFRERFVFLSELNALRERVQRAANRAETLEREASALLELLESETDGDVRDALNRLVEQVAAARESLAGRRSFRDPTLRSQASRLFRELSGDDVRQGTLRGPTPVQRRRLTQLSEAADEMIAALETIVNGWLPEINRMLREKGELLRY